MGRTLEAVLKLHRKEVVILIFMPSVKCVRRKISFAALSGPNRHTEFFSCFFHTGWKVTKDCPSRGLLSLSLFNLSEEDRLTASTTVNGLDSIGRLCAENIIKNELTLKCSGNSPLLHQANGETLRFVELGCSVKCEEHELQVEPLHHSPI